MRETEHLVLFKLKYYVLFLICFPSFAAAQTYPNRTVDSLLKSGIDQIINQNYDSARLDFTRLNNEFPGIPLGKIYLAALDISESFDKSVPLNEDSVQSKLDSAEEQAKELVDKDENNEWNHYFLALAEGYYAYFRAAQRSWVNAYFNAVSSVNDFEKCLKINPKFYEAYIAVGIYKFWKSRKTEFLSWLPFVSNEEDEGIKDIHFAIKHPSYNTYLAVSSLMWIYIDQKKYNDAVTIADSALAKYPGSRFFKWGLARAYEGIDVRKAIPIYKEILDGFLKRKVPNRYYEIVLMHIIAQQYHKLNEDKKALELCDKILSYKDISPFVRERLGKRLERVRELKEELSGQAAVRR